MVEPVDVVIGAGSGMGAAAARALSGGRRMLLVDRDFDAVSRLAAEIGGEPVACDIADPASIAALAQRIERLGSLIGTAGVSGPPGAITLTINLIGYARLLEALDGAIGEGTAINLFASMVELAPVSPEVTSILESPLDDDFFDKLRAADVDPDDPGMGYVLSKVGIVRLVRTKARAYWDRGARITSISPGVIDTPLLDLTKDTPVVQQMKSIVHRFGDPAEVGRVAAFLVSEDASYVTGINVNVDGGYQTFVGETLSLQEELARTQAETQVDARSRS